MPVQLLTSSDSDDQIVLFIDSCRRAPWAAVTRIAVLLKARDEHPLFSFRIDHVLVPDPEDQKKQIAHPDPTTDVRQIVHQVAAHARKRKRTHTYTFVVVGHSSKSVRGKVQIAEDTEIEIFRMPLVIGEGEAGDEDDAETGPLKIVAGLLRELGTAYKENATDRNGIIDLYRGELDAMSTRNKTLAEAAAAGASQSVELTRLLVEDKREQRKENREDAAAGAAMAHEHQMETMRSERLTNMASAAMTSPHIAPQLGRVIGAVADLIESLKRGASTVTGGATDVGSESARADGTLGPRMAAILGKLNEKALVALEAALTQDVYDRILAASKKTSDDEVRAILEPIQELWNPQDRIVNGDDGKPDASRSKVYSDVQKKKAEARKVAALNGALAVFEEDPNLMPAFVRVLEDAGLKLR